MSSNSYLAIRWADHGTRLPVDSLLFQDKNKAIPKKLFELSYQQDYPLDDATWNLFVGMDDLEVFTHLVDDDLITFYIMELGGESLLSSYGIQEGRPATIWRQLLHTDPMPMWLANIMTVRLR
jgi:hypothetical protein